MYLRTLPGTAQFCFLAKLIMSEVHNKSSSSFRVSTGFFGGLKIHGVIPLDCSCCSSYAYLHWCCNNPCTLWNCLRQDLHWRFTGVAEGKGEAFPGEFGVGICGFVTNEEDADDAVTFGLTVDLDLLLWVGGQDWDDVDGWYAWPFINETWCVFISCLFALFFRLRFNPQILHCVSGILRVWCEDKSTMPWGGDVT